MKIKRFVTAETELGGVYAKVEDIAGEAEGDSVAALMDIWGYDGPPTLPIRPEDISGEYEKKGLFPYPGGMRVALVTMPPKGWGPHEAVEDPVGLDLGSGGNYVEHESGGEMHRTDTVDLIVVLQGTIDVVFPEADGSEGEMVLAAGDFLVQNGAFHRWHNSSEESCTFMAFIFPAERAE